MKRITLLCCTVGLLGLSLQLFGQGVGSSADIRGTVTDSSGAVLTNVGVTVLELGKGTSRSALTDSTGQFRITGLPPSGYDVRVDRSGFEPQVQKNVSLSLGETAVIDFRMKVSTRKEVVEVMSEPPTVDTERSSQAPALDPRGIRRGFGEHAPVCSRRTEGGFQ